MKKLIIDTATKTCKIESKALETLADSLDDKFVKTVEQIYTCKGRIVVTGIGKSALIAQKIVATFNSTGTPSIFMHAADAIHGDLGMIQADDFVLCISKSGETSEIKVLLPLLNHLGHTIIGMVANLNSYLSKNAHFLLHTPINIEADPNNLAPTTTTTVQAAMGDAVATSLLALRGFSPNDFAMYHPGGSLGKQLYLKVADLTHNNQRPHVHSKSNLRNTILEMTSKRLGCTVVLDDQDKILGIITDGDLRRMLTSKKDLTHVTASDIMTPNPVSINHDTLAVKALQLMRAKSISHLVVVKDKLYLGIIHLHDLIKEGLV